MSTDEDYYPPNKARKAIQKARDDFDYWSNQ